MAAPVDPRLRVLIVADDLTGAADAAAPFVAAGWRAAVWCAGTAPRAEVVAVSSGSRGLPPERARAAVEACCARFLPLAPGLVVFKKVDSTLRGQPRAEVEAALRTLALRRAVVAPALPAQGRVTVNGVQLAHGQPVDRTPAGSDPLAPARTARLAELFAGLRCDLLDARDDADLDRAAAAAPLAGTLWVGSAGLAAALARRLGAPRAGTRRRQESVRRPRGHMALPPRGRVSARRDTAAFPAWGDGPPPTAVLAVCGSRHPATAAQVRRLAECRGAVCVEVDGSGPATGAVVAALACGRDAVLRPTPGEGRPADVVAARLAACAAQVLAACSAPPALLLTGGDTAAAVLRAVGAAGLRLAGEVEPGVTLGVVEPGGWRAATKAGGFGDEGALVRAAACLTAARAGGARREGGEGQ